MKPLADDFEVPVYVLLVLGYPYHWRCKYLHGNHIVPLFMAHNDDDFCCLKIINYFMDRFLEEEIPKMFKEDYWNDKKYDAVVQMIKKCDEKPYKKYEQGKIKAEKKNNVVNLSEPMKNK